MDNWRKSSYSGPDDGNNCVEISTTPTHTAIRDSKAPVRATLAFPAGAFTAFIESLKAPVWRKSSYSEGGDGNECVEIATTPTRTAVRDSKDPSARTLTFPAGAFAGFVEGIKAAGRRQES